ncbi:MAG: 3-hydroxybutyryl-CoA dehydrogenase [Firmicutes bacterium]|nr:3-hydroxybutyryl-CoA dehydrogenase [Bacillota bacterium]
MKTIGVIGAGTMGSGIAQTMAQSGYEVIISEISQELADRGLAGIEKNLDKLVAKGRLSRDDKDAAVARITATCDIGALKAADVVIEAAIENMEAKKTLFRQLDEVCEEKTILATNTSALSITEIAAVTDRPDKVIGMHFFNPVPVMKLVEVISGLCASEETKKAIIQLAESAGKTPVEVEEAPGFVVNRILIPMINEAGGIVADGVSTVEEVDTAMKLGANHPMGPLALGDLIGLDVCLAIMETLQREYGDSKYRPHPLLRKMVRAKKLGRKTGEGFYQY